MFNSLLHKLTATTAIAKADLIATFRNPTSVFFGLLFPLVFIITFGSLGGGQADLEVGVDPNVNTANPIIIALDEIDTFKLIYDDFDVLKEDLSKGEIDAYLKIIPNEKGQGFEVDLITSSAAQQTGPIVESVIEGMVDKINLSQLEEGRAVAKIKVEELEGREFKNIDFVLPGMLGFSLLSSGIIGTAFLFVELRDNLVIKRFFATPITKFNIVVGLALSKLVFALMQASVLIVIGTVVFDFTLLHGFSTLLQMLMLASIGILIFLGFGFLVSTIAKDRNAVPPAANLFTLPQFLLAGTIFPVAALPEWLQPVSKYLPLTYFNEGMRQISFEGIPIYKLQDELLFLAATAVIVYFVVIKTFKWD